MEEAPADDDSAVVSNGTRCAPPPEANVRFRPALAGPLVRPPLTALLPPAAEAEAEALPPAFSLFNAVGSYIVAGLQRIMNRSNPARANDQISAMIGRAVFFFSPGSVCLGVTARCKPAQPPNIIAAQCTYHVRSYSYVEIRQISQKNTAPPVEELLYRYLWG